MRRFFKFALAFVLCLAVVLSPSAFHGIFSSALLSGTNSAHLYSSSGIENGGDSEDSLAVFMPAEYKDKKVYPGGVPFGVKFYTDGIIVIGFSDVEGNGGKINPAYEAGIRLKDIIIKIDGKDIKRAEELTGLVEGSGGKAIALTYLRNGKEYTVNVTPEFSSAEGRYKSGLWVRDSGAGIGTVTFIDPETLSFGGLGHGICDGETGELIPMDRGSVLGVKINGVNKGTPGAPGEIKGYFSSGKTGTLISNTVCGVYGVFGELPASLPSEPIPVGSCRELKDGEAFIYCTLDNEGPQKYSVTISEINRSATGNKCFTVKVTDKRLIEKTGGIVQGMSGSPIIQNGKLVGAVTHVLINDPTTGYGIFIENMLTAAHMPMQKAA